MILCCGSPSKLIQILITKKNYLASVSTGHFFHVDLAQLMLIGFAHVFEVLHQVKAEVKAEFTLLYGSGQSFSYDS